MGRTKAWWSKFDEYERWFIWNFERSQNKGSGMGGYLPDDCSECVICDNPMLGSGICNTCGNQYDKLIEKGKLN